MIFKIIKLIKVKDAFTIFTDKTNKHVQAF